MVGGALAVAMTSTACAMDNPLFGRGDDGAAQGSGEGDAGEKDDHHDGEDDEDGSHDAGEGDADADADAEAGQDDDGAPDDDDDDDAATSGETGDGVDGTAGLDAGAEDGESGDDDDDGESSGGIVDEPARPEAVYIFGGGRFEGAIHFDGLDGIAAAEAACITARAESFGSLPCAGDPVPILREGPSDGAMPNLATFLNVVPSTSVRAPTNIDLASADAFFEGPHTLPMVAAGVFADPVGVSHLWLGFDDDADAPNCEDWTVEGGGVEGVVGDAGGGYLWYATGVWPCQIQLPILCACW